MDFDSSSKFISSLAKFLQSLCNGYVEFDNGVEVIGHIYLNVDTGKKIDYVLNEKVCKTDQNSVTFISNSFHAQPAEKPKPVEKLKAKPPPAPSEPDNDDNDIILMDDPVSEQSFDQYNDNSSVNNKQRNSTSHPKLPRSLGASKRSHHSHNQSSVRPSKSAKYDSMSSSSLNPNSAHLPVNNNSSANDSSFNVSAGSITAASESDLSHLSQVFPEGVDHTNSQDIKPVLDKDMNVINVKQEYDPAADAQGDGGTSYDDPGDGSYYSQDQSYGETGNDYYGGGHPNSNDMKSDFDPSNRYLGEGGSADNLGDAQDVIKWRCRMCDKEFEKKYRLTEHIKGVHDRSLTCFCTLCGKEFTHKKNISRHLAKVHGFAASPTSSSPLPLSKNIGSKFKTKTVLKHKFHVKKKI